MAMAMAMSMGVMSFGAPLLSSSRSKGSSNLRQSSSPVARSFSSPSSSFFAGSSLSPKLTLGWGSVSTQRSSVVKVRAGKPALGCTKRSRSRKSIARTSGFRVRLRTPGGRNILRRRRAKGRKDLCPSSNPNSGKRA